MLGVDPTLITAISAVIVSIIAGWFSWRSGKRKSNIDYAGVIQKGFAGLIDELQQQHASDQKEIKLCHDVVQDLSIKVSILTTYIGKLEQFLRHHGLWDEAPKVDLIGIPKNGHR